MVDSRNPISCAEPAPAMEVHCIAADQVLERFGTSVSGLSAQQVEERLARHGHNCIEVQIPSPLLKEFFDNYFHSMAMLLWITGGIAFAAQMPQLAIAIWLVNVINGSFSFWQEFRAQRAVEALNKLLPPVANVLREDRQMSIPAVDLVPGDIVLLEEGDRISADMRIIASQSLTVDQSVLTGESRPVRKSWNPETANGLSRSEIANLVYAGTSVLSGHGRAVVCATGVSTEFGKIAHLTQTIVDQPSPLQNEMRRVTKIVSIFSISIGVAIFFCAKLLTAANTVEAFIFSLGMVVAFVPEGMVPTVTLSLALAVQRMVRRQALVKRLSSVEALGSCNVICTDKTGTLTENEMTVTSIFAGNAEYQISGLGYSTGGEFQPEPNQENDAALFELLKAGVLCNNASLDHSGQKAVCGDPTEIALIIAAVKASPALEKIESTRLYENVFDSRRKCMSTVHAGAHRKVVYVKGSPSQIIDRCNRELISCDEKTLNKKRKSELLAQVNSYAKDGLRVIAAARLILDENETDYSVELVETNLCFLGLFAMYDPPRLGVVEAVRKCKDAGIQVVMITGDYEVTAEAIARKVGIVRGARSKVITGPQLDSMSEPEFIEAISEDLVFARVNPEHKLRIVSAFQSRGLIVAVTGDGVNDAPALKKADIGVAMGQNGAAVAKESADMILMDDNFSSIVNAIEEGRAVYENIKKFAMYVFISNMAEAAPFAVMLLSCGIVPMPLTVMQVLSIDLGTDMVPALGLGADAAEHGIMERSPRSLKQPLLSASLLTKALLWYGLIEAIAGMSGYFFVNWLHGYPAVPLAPVHSEVWKQATSMTLSCIVFGQVGAVFCCRSRTESVFSSNFFQNRLVVAGVFFEILLLLSLLFFPFLNAIFDTTPLGLTELGFALSWAVVMILLDEVRKLFIRRHFR